MKERILGLLKNLRLRDALTGALVGLILTAAIQPFALAFFTDVWIEVGAPGHTPPPIEADMNKIETAHSPGEVVDEYGNLTWKEEYEAYRVVIENKGNKPVYDLETRVPLPGCIVGISENNPFSEEDYGLTNQLSAGIEGNLSQSKYRCSKIVNSDQLFPGEKIVVDFAVKDRFKECSVLVGLHDKPELITDYQWRKSNQIYSKVVFNSVVKLESEFEQFREVNTGIMIVAGKPYGRTYGVVVPYNISGVSEPREVLHQCGLRLPKGS